MQLYGTWGIPKTYIWKDDDGTKHKIGTWVKSRHEELGKHHDNDNEYTMNGDYLEYFSIAGFFAKDSPDTSVLHHLCFCIGISIVGSANAM